jgi:hypothetical protein
MYPIYRNTRALVNHHWGFVSLLRSDLLPSNKRQPILSKRLGPTLGSDNMANAGVICIEDARDSRGSLELRIWNLGAQTRKY